MTDLSRLTVSLTKHGAHKVAALLKKYGVDEVLKHLSGSEAGINIELAQAKQTLSAYDGRLPGYWRRAQEAGSETVDALVLIAIIFSHHKLISAMKESGDRSHCAGTVRRGGTLDGKAFTNFAHIIEELGYSTEHSPNHVRFNLHKLFQISGLNQLATQLLETRLSVAGWDKRNSLLDEIKNLGFHDVFCVDHQSFEAWLKSGDLENHPNHFTEDDKEFFTAAEDDEPSTKDFAFHAGHNRKKTGQVKRKASKAEGEANLLHNALQNSLYDALCKRYGAEHVGTEVDTGRGTSIDVVVRTADFCWFYEIKTDASVKGCIRQAIPQLLEYAYWHGKADRADRLIIVGPSRVTAEAEVYLKFLRDNFGLPLTYQQHTAPRPALAIVKKSETSPLLDAET